MLEILLPGIIISTGFNLYFFFTYRQEWLHDLKLQQIKTIEDKFMTALVYLMLIFPIVSLIYLGVA